MGLGDEAGAANPPGGRPLPRRRGLLRGNLAAQDLGIHLRHHAGLRTICFHLSRLALRALAAMGVEDLALLAGAPFPFLENRNVGKEQKTRNKTTVVVFLVFLKRSVT